jgi:uncharacterized protein (DUF2384 family)
MMEQLNVITAEQAAKLARAVELLNEANCLMQEGLGACDFCYEAHNMLENLQDDLTQIADQQQHF